MKSTKYLVLTLIAIAVSGLVWWSKLSPVVSSPTIQLQTEPLSFKQGKIAQSLNRSIEMT
ncbi:MAG: hypothetical protein WBM32_03855 [Crocosphaera sp.]|jgi:hypothetical protein